MTSPLKTFHADPKRQFPKLEICKSIFVDIVNDCPSGNTELPIAKWKLKVAFNDRQLTFYF